MTLSDGGLKGVVDPTLQQEIEQFLYEEADLLDGWRWRDWLGLVDPTIRYVGVTRPNLEHRDLRKALEGGGRETAIFDDDIESLTTRVDQLEQHNHWAENPGSRTRHLVTNVRIEPTIEPDRFRVQSSFLLCRTRLERQMDLLAGQRADLLRRDAGPGGWRIVQRTILLDTATVLWANISTLL